MELTAGIPGIAHHELPEYLDQRRADPQRARLPREPVQPDLAGRSRRSCRASSTLGSCSPASTRCSRCCRSSASRSACVVAADAEPRRSSALVEAQAERNRDPAPLLRASTTTPRAGEGGAALRARGRAARAAARAVRRARGRARMRLADPRIAAVDGARGCSSRRLRRRCARRDRAPRSGRARSVGDVVLVLTHRRPGRPAARRAGVRTSRGSCARTAPSAGCVWFEPTTPTRAHADARAAPSRRRCRTASPTASRFEGVAFAYPAREQTGARRRRPAAARRERRSRSSARTAPARRRSSSCCAASTSRPRAASSSTASTCARFPVEDWRGAHLGGLPGLRPVRARSRASRSASATCRVDVRRRSVLAALDRAAAADVARRRCPAGLDDPARARRSTAASSSRSGSGRSWRSAAR